MSEEIDRRASGTTRIPFDALVEVGGSLGPAFEAKAIDVSATGIHLRTAYLPEIGQTLSCRFETASAADVSASGEVVWCREEERGGEFGIRFDDLDADSSTALKSMAGIEVTATDVRPERGARVRLHIDGLGSPMRARVKDSLPDELTVGSNLSFLQLGQALELEETDQGARHTVHVERVSIEIENQSCVPQLVVGLRYPEPSIPIHTAAPLHEDVRETASVRAETPRETVVQPEKPKSSRAPRTEGLQALLARKTNDATPAMARLAKRLQATAALLINRVGKGAKDDDPAIRSSFSRKTAPAPEGALHTSGRKVLRGTAMNQDNSVEPKFKMNRGTLAVGGAVGLAGILTLFALNKSATTPPADSESTASVAANTVAAPLDPSVIPTGTTTSPTPDLAPAPAPSAVDPLAAAINPPSFDPASTGAVAPTAPPSVFPYSSVSAAAPEPEATVPERKPATRRKVPPTVSSFGNGPVAHGNVLRLKMDGPIAKIQGATHPTGFTVALPHRRSLEAAGPLAARDSRIASIRVTNDSSGAELSLNFKDGVPHYQVRARGDVLEIALAAPGIVTESKTVAQKDASASRNPRTTAKHTDRAKKPSHHPHKKAQR